MEKIKVSVLMAVYNNEDHLKEAIESVFSQTYKKIELIFIDDSSTDNSLKIAKEIKKGEKRVKILKMNKNGGQATALKAGLKKASGKYITFLDGDDLMHKKRVEDQLKFMLKNNLDFSYCDMQMFNKKGEKEIRKAPDFKKKFKEMLREKRREKFDLKTRPGFHTSNEKDPKKVRTIFNGGFMFKKEILKKFNYDEKLKRIADQDFWIKAIFHNLKIKRFPKAYYYYRQHEGQISKKINLGDSACIYINKKLISGGYESENNSRTHKLLS